MLEEENSAEKNASIILACEEACGAFSSSVIDVRGSSSFVDFHPWVGDPGYFKNAGKANNEVQANKGIRSLLLLQFLTPTSHLGFKMLMADRL